MRFATRVLVPLSALLFATGSASAPDDLDTFVMDQIARRHVAGLSLAIVQDGKIIVARAYGVTDRGSSRPVTTSTLFQAGSISKSVAALGALHLVEQWKLTLDTDVNTTLKSWKLPASEFTASKPVTLRGLLSHTAGLTVHGFPGYDADSVVPTLVQVLDGTRPANTAAIRNDTAPGARWNYSGGGYTIMQQMIIDVTGQRFPDYMRQTVLAPIGMTQSSYEQPLPSALAALTAAGHYEDGKIVHSRWHVYPEMAAAGLWTTPSDLARFAIEVQQAYAGKSSKVISQAMAKQMLTDQKDMDGLGVFLQGSGKSLWFSHNGRDEGFDASLNAAAETGQGIAIMINANDNSRLVGRIGEFIARKYHWPNATVYVPPAAVPISAAQLDAVAGRYEMANNQMGALIVLKGHLYGSVNGLPDEEFIPLGANTFVSADRDVRLALTRDASGAVTGLTRTQGGNNRPAPRIGPLFSALVQQPDPDASLTSRVTAVVRALGQGGGALEPVQGVTDGARKDLGRDPWRPASGLRRLEFVAAQDVSARGIERHGGKVARILYYRMTTGEGERNLMVHLTSDGLVTDVDVVDE
jgi:CubicO group peptidase (beta-lactamase class C family)